MNETDDERPLHEDEFWCHECGQRARIDEMGIANHLTADGEIDYDADADHVPFEMTAFGAPDNQRANETAATKRLSLAREVFQVVVDAAETLEGEDRIGPDLAYLLGAVVMRPRADGLLVGCEWPESRPLVRLLRQRLPADHGVWRCITVEPEEPDARRTSSARP